MTQWTRDELSRVGRAEEIQVAAVRRDGTLRKAVTIWVVAHGESLYVRSVRGHAGAWFRGTQERREGHISAGSIQRDVSFTDADHQHDDEIDAAYRAKYRRYTGRVLNSVLTPEARSTTTKLTPRSPNA